MKTYLLVSTEYAYMNVTDSKTDGQTGTACIASRGKNYSFVESHVQ